MNKPPPRPTRLLPLVAASPPTLLVGPSLRHQPNPLSSPVSLTPLSPIHTHSTLANLGKTPLPKTLTHISHHKTLTHIPHQNNDKQSAHLRRRRSCSSPVAGPDDSPPPSRSVVARPTLAQILAAWAEENGGRNGDGMNEWGTNGPGTECVC